jgi:hypothetical protein
VSPTSPPSSRALAAGRRVPLALAVCLALLATMLPTSAQAASASLPTVLVQGVASPTDAANAEVVVVHGVPGLVVDVLVDGAAAIEGFRFGDVAVAELPAGTYDLGVAPAGSTDAILELEDVEVAAGTSYSVVAHLDADGAPVLSPFVNDTDDTGIQAFHVAAFPEVVLLTGSTVLADDVANGDDAKFDLPAGTTVADVGIGLAGTSDAAIALGDVTVPADTVLLVYAVGPGIDFSDVASTNVHRENVLWLANRGVVQGYDDGTFRPSLSVTRGQLASLMARTAGLTPAAGPYDFTDIAGSVHAGNIQALADAGIIAGFSDDTFRPSEPVTRAQAASLLGRWLDVDEVAEGPFTDVAAGSTHAEYINSLYDLGVINGTTATTFSPAAPLQRAQTASLIARSLDVLDEG